jgi:hypothetical protein
VVRPVGPAKAGSPGGRNEGQNRQKEEHTRDLKPEGPADTPKGAQKTADPAGNPSRGLACGLPGAEVPQVRLRGAGGGRSWPSGYGLSDGSHALSCYASRDAQADAESAPNGMRLHFDLMVTACLPVWVCLGVPGFRVARKRRRK